jgi:hypothetical protein
LPAPAASLPAPRAAAPLSFELDLPSLAEAPLPASRDADLLDLPVIGVGLPAPTAGLPSVSAGLPSTAAALPSISAALPSPAASPPMPAPGLPVPGAAVPSRPALTSSPGFGELDLPEGGGAVPAPIAKEEFGELDLPRDPPPPPPPLISLPAGPARADEGFGEVTFGAFDPVDASLPPTSGNAPGTPSDGRAPALPELGRNQSELGFGEVDLGGGEGGAASDAASRPAAAVAGVAPPMRGPGGEVRSMSISPTVPKLTAKPAQKRKTSVAKAILIVLEPLRYWAAQPSS